MIVIKHKHHDNRPVVVRGGEGDQGLQGVRDEVDVALVLAGGEQQLHAPLLRDRPLCVGRLREVQHAQDAAEADVLDLRAGVDVEDELHPTLQHELLTGQSS